VWTNLGSGCKLLSRLVAPKRPKDAMPKVSEQLVNRFWELHNNLKSYPKAWASLYDWSLQQGQARSLGSPVDSWKSASGKAFEEIAIGIINDQVTNSRLRALIRILRWGQADPDMRRGILAEPVWPKGQIKEAEIAESKVDVIAVAVENEHPYRLVSVYSCKSSVAERYQQDLFWAEKIRGRGIKFCFVTIDAGFIKHATTPRDTGTAGRGKTLPLAQALYDRIYLLTDDPIVTEMQVFRKIETVVDDLDLWLKAY